MEVPFAKPWHPSHSLRIPPPSKGYPGPPLQPSPEPGWIGKILALEMVTHPGWGGRWWQHGQSLWHTLETPLAPLPTTGHGMGKEAVPGKIPRDPSPGQHRPPCTML